MHKSGRVNKLFCALVTDMGRHIVLLALRFEKIIVKEKKEGKTFKCLPRLLEYLPTLGSLNALRSRLKDKPGSYSIMIIHEAFPAER